MGDLVRRDPDEIPKELMIKHYKCMIAEKENLIKQYSVNLDRLKTVDIQKLELEIDKANDQIDLIKLKIVDLESIQVNKENK